MELTKQSKNSCKNYEILGTKGCAFHDDLSIPECLLLRHPDFCFVVEMIYFINEIDFVVLQM